MVTINQSISQFLKWPKWVNRCKDHYKDSTNINNMNNMSASLVVFLVCCRRYVESQQKSHVQVDCSRLEVRQPGRPSCRL